MKKPSDSLVGALVLKAQEGDTAESANARRALKKLCEKHDLDFEEIMSGGEKVEYHFLKYKRGQKDLARQIIARYALTKEHLSLFEHKWDTQWAFECTNSQYIETLHAYEILSPLFTKERKKILLAFHHGFIQKHNLYPQFELPKHKTKEETKEEIEARMRGDRLAYEMEDVEINKRLN